jgi:hypothetical protein
MAMETLGIIVEEEQERDPLSNNKEQQTGEVNNRFSKPVTHFQ